MYVCMYDTWRWNEPVPELIKVIPVSWKQPLRAVKEPTLHDWFRGRSSFRYTRKEEQLTYRRNLWKECFYN